MKILVCGAREWTDRRTIRGWLAKLPKGTIIVHGACHLGGADAIADEEARALGLEVRPYPVDHALDGPWPGAGPRRNERMLAAEVDGLDACLAFTWVVAPRDRTAPKSVTRGTADMVFRVLDAGVRITIVPPRRLTTRSLLAEPGTP